MKYKKKISPKVKQPYTKPITTIPGVSPTPVGLQQYVNGGITSADSLALYNNTKDLLNYYSTKNKYKNLDTGSATDININRANLSAVKESAEFIMLPSGIKVSRDAYKKQYGTKVMERDMGKNKKADGGELLGLKDIEDKNLLLASKTGGFMLNDKPNVITKSNFINASKYNYGGVLNTLPKFEPGGKMITDSAVKDNATVSNKYSNSNMKPVVVGEVDKKNSNQIYTYQNNPEYFNSKAVIHENPQYNELIKKSVYAGTHGYNTSTGELIKLKNKIEVPEETKIMSTEKYGKSSQKERFAINPELRKQYIQKSTEEAYKNPLMTAPGMIGMAALPIGFASAYGLTSALGNLGQGNYKTAGLEAGLSALPFIGPGVNAAKSGLAKSMESGLLSNTWRLNPLRFKPNPNSLYRGIGEAGYKDAIETGLIRPNPKGNFTDLYTSPYFDFAETYGNYGKGKQHMVQLPRNLEKIAKDIRYGGSEVIFDKPISIDQGKFYKQDWLRRYKPIETPSVGNVVTQTESVTPKPWQLQELPGLHLKSTMSDGAIFKIVEPKTGLVNVEQALGIIGKESGGADKVALIKKGLGENIPKKMDFNEFRKITQDQLIPLERQFATHSSNYGINRLGYLSPKRSSYDISIQTTKDAIARGENVAENQIHLENLLKEYNELPLENQTLILSNKNKFGRGSDAHNNPAETLGHIHFLRDAESPDVLTVTQIQSDVFQGTHRSMPKKIVDGKLIQGLSQEDRIRKSLERMEQLQERNKSVLNKMKTEGLDEAGLPVQDYQIKQFEDLVKAQEQNNLFKRAELENFTQKSLLDKNHQERYLQELVNYAGERGDVTKLRLPTSETAAKVQGYQKIDHFEKLSDLKRQGLRTDEGIYVKNNDLYELRPWNSDPKNYKKISKEEYEIIENKFKDIVKQNYKPEHQTILKKYSEQPKTIKKLFGVEPKIVTDSKGNTWYEVDIPENFKGMKGEIKAFGLGGFIGAGAATQQKKQGGWLDNL